MAHEGDDLCRKMLGIIYGRGLSQNMIVERRNCEMRGCNYPKIQSITSSAAVDNKMVRS